MTNQHKATPEQWAYAETCAPEDFAGYACILELRGRVEALEAGQQPPQDKLDRLIALDRDDSTNSLVERVADAIAAQATSAGIVNDRPARAAILVVAAWMSKHPFGKNWAMRLEREANRG
jgi:hypothetical protein